MSEFPPGWMLKLIASVSLLLCYVLLATANVCFGRRPEIRFWIGLTAYLVGPGILAFTGLLAMAIREPHALTMIVLAVLTGVAAAVTSQRT